MKLVDIYTVLPDATDILWGLLRERSPDVNISHRQMPTLAEHQQFIASKPYAHWYVIDAGEADYVGAVYLTRSREVGVGVLRRYAGFGYGKMAVQLLMDKHPGKFLANINPRNYNSVALFMDLGFHQLQVTYQRSAA